MQKKLELISEWKIQLLYKKINILRIMLEIIVVK